MSGGACKVVINSETASAMASAKGCMKTFHDLVYQESFEKLSAKQQEKSYDDQIDMEVELTRCLTDFCRKQGAMHLDLATNMDNA